ncbi:Uncharacterized protein FKW44_005459, partial [Caligus rogercresseyi]
MVTIDTGFYIAEACGDADDTTVHYGKERHFANLQVIAVVGSVVRRWAEAQFLHICGVFEKKSLPVVRAHMENHGGFNMMVQVVIHLSYPAFLRTEAPGFFPKEAWPPHSPDAAPMDYAIFGRLKSSLVGLIL